MHQPRRTTLALTLAAALSAALATLPSPAAAQTAAQPAAAPLRIIVPTPAGGASDAAARALAQGLARLGGRQVLVENRPGASGAIAAKAVLDARPDGQTLLWTLASMSAIPMLQKAPPFQALSDFVPVGTVGRLTFAMLAPADAPWRSAGDYVIWGRGQANAPTVAWGTLGEMMAAVQFMAATGSRSEYVPYKGGAQLMPDLAGHRVDLNFGPLAGALGAVRAGKVRALAVLAAQRSPLLPEVPTLAEAGITTGPLPTWQALVAPPATPPDVAQRLAREVAAVMADAEVRAAFERQGLQVEAGGPDALAALVRADAATWKRFIAEHAIPME